MVKIGVVGAGHLGRYHIDNFKALEGVSLVGFYEKDKKRAAQISWEHKVRSFEDLESLLKRCDGVSIVVPTHSHYEIARQAIKNNVHIFCEKPFMETLSEADEIIAQAREHGLILQIGHIERFNPALALIKTLEAQPLFIESHRIAEFNPRGIDVAVILDLMIHDIDIILSLVKSPVATIHTTGSPVLTETIDIANARIEFENGCVANVTASRVSQKQMRKLRIFQKDEYISIDFLRGESEIYSLFADKRVFKTQTKPVAEFEVQDGERRKIYYQKFRAEDTNAMRDELAAFVHCIRDKKHPPVTGEDGRRALKIALEIEKQINIRLKKNPRKKKTLS